ECPHPPGAVLGILELDDQREIPFGRRSRLLQDEMPAGVDDQDAPSLLHPKPLVADVLPDARPLVEPPAQLGAAVGAAVGQGGTRGAPEASAEGAHDPLDVARVPDLRLLPDPAEPAARHAATLRPPSTGCAFGAPSH